MSFGRKYITPILTYLLVYVFGFVFIFVGGALSRYAYAYMNYLFPRLFPIFSAVSEKESYERYLTLLCALGVFVAIWLVNYFTLRLDNVKFELMIRRTDGFYTIAEGFPIYLQEFGISELISGILLPTLLVIPPYFIPELGVQSIPVVGFLVFLLENLLWLGYSLKEYFGIAEALLLVLLFSLISRVALIPGNLKRWRASWLSGSVE